MKFKYLFSLLVFFTLRHAYADNLFCDEFTILKCKVHDVEVEIVNLHAWRDWQPIVTRPGPDHGSPLMIGAEIKITNEAPSRKDAHWEAFIRDEDGINHPVEMWDTNSKVPWGGSIQPVSRFKVKLYTRSGPYLKAGKEIQLFIRFYIDGEAYSIKSKKVEIIQTM